jgi:uncharacterized protein YcbK (DUF882 family)
MQIIEWQSGERLALSEWFSTTELECRCNRSHKHQIAVDLIAKLDHLRERLDKPIRITSGYRCPEHNQAVGGVADSQHTQGTAADIVVYDVHPDVVAKIAEEIGFTGIGLYDTFTHVDVRPQKAQWDHRTK